MSNDTGLTPLFEGGLTDVEQAAQHLNAVGIASEIKVAGDGVPGT